MVPSNLLVAGALAATGGVILAWPKLVSWWRAEPDEQREADSQSEDPTPQRRIRELDGREQNLVEGVDLEVRFNHGHSDFWGIVEDVFEEKRLSNSLCTECGKPRNHYISFDGERERRRK